MAAEINDFKNRWRKRRSQVWRLLVETWNSPYKGTNINIDKTKGTGDYAILLHQKIEKTEYAQIEYHLLVSPYTTRRELESILLEVLGKAKKEKLKKHEQVTRVYIYAFSSLFFNTAF